MRKKISAKAGNGRSLRSAFIVRIAVFLIPSIAALLISLLQIMRAYGRQMDRYYAQLMHGYSSSVDSMLDSACRSLYSIDISTLNRAAACDSDDFKRMESLRSVGDSMEACLNILDQMDALYIYDPDKEDILFTENYGTSFAENRSVALALSRRMAQEPDSKEAGKGKYRVVHTDYGDFIYTYSRIDGQWLGCWFSTAKLARLIGESGAEGILSLYFSSEEGRLELTPGVQSYRPETAEKRAFDPNTHTVRADSSSLHDRPVSDDEANRDAGDLYITETGFESVPLTLTIVWDKSVTHQTSRRLGGVVVGTCILAALLLGFFFVFLRNELFRPVRRLSENIDGLGLNPPKEPERDARETAEFRKIYAALTHMMWENRNLKIDVYEKDLEQQKAQLQLYQLQIRPHFFLNSLNTIRCQIQMGDIHGAGEITDLLTRHCRYVLYSNQMVLLDEELDFVENYVKLRGLQHNRRYQLQIDCPDELRDCSIPVLILQIPVENTLKYADSEKAPASALIRIRSEQKDGKKFLEIHIRDHGPGFSEDMLRRLRTDCGYREKNQQHGVGLENICRRLKIIYRGEAGLKFSNAPDSGACVDIELPESGDGPGREDSFEEYRILEKPDERKFENAGKEKKYQKNHQRYDSRHPVPGISGTAACSDVRGDHHSACL